jgi:hypothetical protein
VLDEIELRYRQGYRVIDFEDDNLTYYKERFKELCARLIGRFPDLELVAMNGISYLSLDDDLLELMRRAGFSQLNLALVSSDKTVRETTKRPHTLRAYLNIVERAAELGFRIVSYQILGLPNERVESMVQTIAVNARLPVLLGASPFYLTPRAPVARGVEFKPDDYVRSRLTALGVDGGQSGRRDVYTLLVTTRIINFLKGFEPSGSVRLSELRGTCRQDRRTQTGIELLTRLFEEGKLYFATASGLRENHQFDSSLFFRVMDEAQSFQCLNGGSIDVSDACRST